MRIYTIHWSVAYSKAVWGSAPVMQCTSRISSEDIYVYIYTYNANALAIKQTSGIYQCCVPRQPWNLEKGIQLLEFRPLLITLCLLCGLYQQVCVHQLSSRHFRQFITNFKNCVLTNMKALFEWFPRNVDDLERGERGGRMNDGRAYIIWQFHEFPRDTVLGVGSQNCVVCAACDENKQHTHNDNNPRKVGVSTKWRPKQLLGFELTWNLKY